MKKFPYRRLIAAAMLVVFSSFSVNCGLLLYPERKGTKGGKIDVRVLIMDCLWLLVGVVPGVVALVVDFATGCIYEGGTAMNGSPGQEFGFRIKGAAPADADVEVVLYGGNQVTTLTQASWRAGEEREEEIFFALPPDLEAGTYTLSVAVNGLESSNWTVNVGQ